MLIFQSIYLHTMGFGGGDVSMIISTLSTLGSLLYLFTRQNSKRLATLIKGAGLNRRFTAGSALHPSAHGSELPAQYPSTASHASMRSRPTIVLADDDGGAYAIMSAVSNEQRLAGAAFIAVALDSDYAGDAFVAFANTEYDPFDIYDSHHSLIAPTGAKQLHLGQGDVVRVEKKDTKTSHGKHWWKATLLWSGQEHKRLDPGKVGFVPSTDHPRQKELFTILPNANSGSANSQSRNREYLEPWGRAAPETRECAE